MDDVFVDGESNEIDGTAGFLLDNKSYIEQKVRADTTPAPPHLAGCKMLQVAGAEGRP